MLGQKSGGTQGSLRQETWPVGLMVVGLFENGAVCSRDPKPGMGLLGTQPSMRGGICHFPPTTAPR